MTVPCCPAAAPCPSHRDRRALARACLSQAAPMPDLLPAQVIRMVGQLRRHALAVLEVADRRQAALDATTEALTRLVVDYQDLAAAADALTAIRAVVAELDGCDGWERHELEFTLARVAELAGVRSPAAPDASSGGCPAADGLVRHARATCTDPVAARLGWHCDSQERQS